MMDALLALGIFLFFVTAWVTLLMHNKCSYPFLGGSVCPKKRPCALHEDLRKEAAE